MSSIAGGCCPDMGYCQALVLGFDLVNGPNNSTFKATPVGVTQALLDPMNTAEANYDIQPDGTPSVRKIRVQRIPRGNFTDAQDEVTCDITTSNTINEQCIEVLQEVNVSFRITNEEMEKYCSDAWNIVNTGTGMTDMFERHIQFIQSKMNALRTAINKKVITLALANVGINITHGDNLSHQLDLVDATTGAKIEKGIQDLLFDMTNNEVYGTPLIAGLGNFDRFNTSANFGCCNQYGLDWEGMISTAPYKYYRDVMIKDITGNANQFLVFGPGTTQFVFYNNLGLGATSMDRRHGNTIYGLIPDPMLPGVVYNIAIEETNCTNNRRDPAWIISMYLYYDVAFMPADAYSDNDRLKVGGAISNGVFLYEGLAV